ncbi:class I SAM-dependent methyltransferase [Rhodoplanes elegans]|nr:class I SAM-dependent methyltransferase [Rhodoplanes elegans]
MIAVVRAVGASAPGDHMVEHATAKGRVQRFWNEAACGENLYLFSVDREGYSRQAADRYALEPFIEPFADFRSASGKKVLEIGVGLGADHQRFAEAGAELYGIDLTERAVAHARRRLSMFGLRSRLAVGDAESLSFPDGAFALVYSWGVIHHTPDTPRAAAEILRVLEPGGTFKVMIYQRRSLVGLMLWVRYALLRLRPFTTMDAIYAAHLESPGTKAYSVREAAALFAGAADVRITTVLTHGDLLASGAGQRHRGLALTVARRVFPRALVRKLLPGWGLFMLISGRKPAAPSITGEPSRQTIGRQTTARGPALAAANDHGVA